MKIEHFIKNSAILFIIFNRPHMTKRVFNEIKIFKPKKLFISADGPRSHNLDDLINCQACREIINEIDWDCELHTLFHETNKGCKNAVSSAISWFFSYVNEGIILEDDCVPDQSFFPFCYQLLDKYRYDERIMMIAGTNYLFDSFQEKESYYFSKYYPIWGWATWKRAWNLYDINMTEWPQFREKKHLEWIYTDGSLVKWFDFLFQTTYEGIVDTWDIQWTYSCIFQNGLCIVPRHNLISNIGIIGHFANGSKVYQWDNAMPTHPIDCTNLIHPVHVIENGTYDLITIRHLLRYRGVPLKFKITQHQDNLLINLGLQIFQKIRPIINHLNTKLGKCFHY